MRAVTLKLQFQTDIFREKLMIKADHLGAYAEGWTTGNVDTFLSALAYEFVF